MNRKSKIYKHSGFTFIDKEGQTIEEWLDTRRDGVGGSDVGVILDLNPYQSALELFYDKLALIPPKDLTKNDSIFWGRRDEASILDVSQYFEDEDDLAYTVNCENKNQIHTHVDFPFFIINDDYPWLQANIDGAGLEKVVDLEYSEKLKQWVYNGELPRMDKIVEIKTIKGRVRDTWTDGVPPGYIVQVITYMLVCKAMGIEYGEIYSRSDGTNMHKYLVPFNESIEESIIQKTYDFQESVDAARAALKGFSGGIEEALQICAAYEPAADSSPAFSKFYTENHLLKEAARAGAVTTDDNSLLEACIKYKSLGADKKEIEKERQYLANFITEWMRKNNSNYVNFSTGGYVSKTTRINISRNIQ